MSNQTLVLNSFGYEAGGWRIEKHPRFLTDLTGDRHADIIGFADAGVYVSLNNGDRTFKPAKLVLNTFGYEAGGWRIEKHPRFLADLTGNGRPDIVGFADAGVYVSFNNGDGTFKPAKLVLDKFG
ncbi:MAG: FG-GAP repeat domain-containing protein, partial [Methanosarcina sp.]